MAILMSHAKLNQVRMNDSEKPEKKRIDFIPFKIRNSAEINEPNTSLENSMT